MGGRFKQFIAKLERFMKERLKDSFDVYKAARASMPPTKSVHDAMRPLLHIDSVEVYNTDDTSNRNTTQYTVPVNGPYNDEHVLFLDMEKENVKETCTYSCLLCVLYSSYLQSIL